MSDQEHISNQKKYLGTSGPLTSNRRKGIELFNRSIEQLFSQRPELRLLSPVTYQVQATARQVIRKGNRDNHVGMFASRLNQTMVPYESTLEKQACASFESFHEIQAYCSQPYAVRLFFAGKVRNVYPDFEMISKDKKIIVDIRHENNTRNPLFQQRYVALQNYAEQRGMAYTLLTEKTIRDQRLLNSQWLLSLAKGKAEPQLTAIVWNHICNLGELTFADLFDGTALYPQIHSVLACLALDGHLVVNWDQPLRQQRVCTIAEAEK